MEDRLPKNSKIVIIGAGPAGLTAAYELCKKGYAPIVLEESSEMGGISRTVNYKGNRMDIGGHRFFSKSDTVMQWWQQFLPIQEDMQSGSKPSDAEEAVMLIRQRRSRILFKRKLFDYPLSVNIDTISKLSFPRCIRIGISYIWIRLRPIRNEKTLEDFFINRFGRELYNTFFRSYTEKVWGVACHEISPEWGAQRIKGLSMRKALFHALRSTTPPKKPDIAQRTTETSLINTFLYPKYGPGQLWEKVADEILRMGGEIRINSKAVAFETGKDRIGAVVVESDGSRSTITCDRLVSSMPVKDLVSAMGDVVPTSVAEVANGLQYRDFITVGVLLKAWRLQNGKNANLIEDNWIYIQEDDVKVGRLQIFNNWSPDLVADPETIWVGMEYFATEGDALWNLSEEAMKELAFNELERIGIASHGDCIDVHVVKVKKAYPAYFGTHNQFHVIREFIDGIDNLFLVGRNGMHRYNNQDHSMLTAMEAVRLVCEGSTDKTSIYEINAEADYHESK